MRKRFDIFYDKNNAPYQVRTKSNAVIIEFGSSIKENLFKEIIDLYDSQDFYSFQILNKILKCKYEYSDIYDVISELVGCELLNFENFEDDELFSDPKDNLSNFDKSNADLSTKKIGLIGSKSLMDKVVCNLNIQEINSIYRLNTEEKITQEQIVEIFHKCDFVAVDEINWNPILMEQINTTALIKDKAWMLIEGLIDLINISFGPIFHGKITACYSCYKSRILSLDVNSKYTQSYEGCLREEKKTAKADIISDIYQTILAFYVSLDILRFVSDTAVPLTWRNALIINKSDYSNKRHSFIKSPMCPVCKTGLDYTPSARCESINV